MSRPVLEIVIGSTRPGRVGLPVAEWVYGRAVDHDGFDVELVDLAQVALPLFDEPQHPMLHAYIHEHTRRWSATSSAPTRSCSSCPSTTTASTRRSRTPSTTFTSSGSTSPSAL